MVVWKAEGNLDKLDEGAILFAEVVGLMLGKLVEAFVMFAGAEGLDFAVGKLKGTKMGKAMGETAMADWLRARMKGEALSGKDRVDDTKPAEAKPISEEGKKSSAELKNAKDGLPSEDGKRRIKIDDEGKCEVCASPCEEIRKKYASQITPEIAAEIGAIEKNSELSDSQKIERLKPIEQKLAKLRFDELSNHPQTKSINTKSIDEAKAILQAEDQALVKNPRRPNLKKENPTWTSR